LTARALMFQGTGSDVGKSLIVAGLCRAFSRRGLRVRPFKPQNMSNNAAVTEDGGEIGRAQALQARACGVPPSVHMNPVLLKPQSEIGAQVVVQGKIIGNARAREYQALKPKLMSAVLDSYGRVSAGADLVLIEGAGSAAEINLREGDIANMGFARAAGCPVTLIGDIDRGGIFAQILGVKAALAAEDAAMIVGFVVNKFRGDPGLFEGAMATIAERAGWRAFGLAPFFADAANLPAEDAFGLGDRKPRAKGAVTIAAPMLKRIANFDDFDPLRLEPSVRLVFVRPGEPLPIADLVVLPGSKATIVDLQFFREQGWDIDILSHARRGGRVLGLCGGYQMLGKRVSDPQGMEGPPGEIEGLGLLDVETVLTAEKTLSQVEGACLMNGAPFRGYEMHVGETKGPDCARPLLRFANGELDGAVSESGRIGGAYVHGLFADDRQRAAWLALLGAASAIDYEAMVERTLDKLADHLEAHLDLDGLLAAARYQPVDEVP
jgi:adenosylcobyric acid synthase